MNHGNRWGLAMSKNAKKKLCWSCEGRVEKAAENCPYCGVYLSPNIPDTPKSAISAPYTAQVQANAKAPVAPYQPKKGQAEEEASEEASEKEAAEAQASISDLKTVLLPLVLLLAGTIFLLFAAVLYLFSQNGVFTLRWNGDNWIYYLALSVPMLFFGWRALNFVKDTPEEE